MDAMNGYFSISARRHVCEYDCVVEIADGLVVSDGGIIVETVVSAAFVEGADVVKTDPPIPCIQLV